MCVDVCVLLGAVEKGRATTHKCMHTGGEEKKKKEQARTRTALLTRDVLFVVVNSKVKKEGCFQKGEKRA